MLPKVGSCPDLPKIDVSKTMVLSSAEPREHASSNQELEERGSIHITRCPDVWFLTPRASAEESKAMVNSSIIHTVTEVNDLQL